MKKLPQTLKLLAPAMLLLLSGCAMQKSATGTQDILLKYHASPGKSFTVNSNMSTVVVTEQMGESMEVAISSASESVYKINSVQDDGTMLMEKEFKSMTQENKNPMGDTSSDFSTWIGKKTGFQVTPAGEVSKITGLDQFPDVVAASGETLNGDYLESTLKNDFIKLPNQPVKKGFSWAVPDTMEVEVNGGNLKQDGSTTYTIGDKVTREGVECIQILVDGTSKMTGEMEQQGMTLEITRETKTTGTLYFALGKGYFQSMDYSATALGEVYIPMASMSIPQNMTTKVSLSTVFD